MFDNHIEVTALDPAAALFTGTMAELEALSDFRNSTKTGQLTSESAFLALHRATREFYRSILSDLFHEFVPLYHSIWKHTTRSAAGPNNLHQDGGVHYFSKKGYGSRMLNIWICVHKSPQPLLAPDELGLYVVESYHPENERLYQELLRGNLHVTGKSATALADNMQVAGAQVEWSLADLRLTSFPYELGTLIVFSSHLLHGSKGCGADMTLNASRYADSYRVALSSVWLHEEDLDPGILEMPEAQYDSLYLWRHDKATWPDLKSYFHDYCEAERRRIADIKRLIELHRSTREF